MRMRRAAATRDSNISLARRRHSRSPAVARRIALSAVLAGLALFGGSNAAEAKTCWTKYKVNSGFAGSGFNVALPTGLAEIDKWLRSGHLRKDIPGHVFVEFPATYDSSSDKLGGGLRKKDFWKNNSGRAQFGIDKSNFRWPHKYTLTKKRAC